MLIGKRLGWTVVFRLPRFQARRHYTAILSSKLDAADSAASQTLSQLGDTLDHFDVGSGA